ncbi:MAG: hypothetical protein IPM75_10395 [Candidatus Competibacteraceae bacterium]|nr:hypothetical protein [Candidatus Competibacteraceae bacterium]
MTAGLARLLDDGDWRRSARDRGPEQARHFFLAKLRRKTVVVYQRLLEEPAHG